MAQVRMVHAADFHIGKPAPGYLGTERGRLRREELFESLRTAVEVARSEGAGLLVISGDLFEHAYCRVGTVREIVALFERNPGLRIFVAPGNHDPCVEGSFYLTLRMPANVYVFRKRSVDRVVLDDPGVIVHGLGWTRFEEPERLLSGYRCEGGYPNVLVVHGEFVAGGQGSSYLPVLPEDVSCSGADYLALGHLHAASEFECGKTHCVYPGSPEPLDFGEAGRHGVYVVDLAANSVKARFVPTAKRQIHRVSCDVTGANTVEQVRRAVMSVGTPSSRKTDLWEVTVTGVVDAGLDIDPDELVRDLSSEFFYLKVVPEVMPDYNVGDMTGARAHRLEDRFVRAVMEELERARAAGDGSRARILQKALYFGLDAIKIGRIVRRGICSAHVTATPPGREP